MKSSCISFACPSCNTNYEVYLKRSPQLMIINCPSCKQSISICEGRTQIVNELIVSQIENAENNFDLLSVLNGMCKKVESPALTADDIINLQIDLQSCKSFDDVMDVICKAR